MPFYASCAQAILSPCHQVLNYPLSRLVEGDEVREVIRLCRGVFGVRANVDVEPRPVREENVRRASPLHYRMEQVPRHFLRSDRPSDGGVEVKTKLGFKPKDATGGVNFERRRDVSADQCI